VPSWSGSRQGVDLPSTQRFITKSAWAECLRIRTKGSATVVDAALAAGVQRVVQESVAMIYRDAGDQWINEDSPVDHYPIAAGNHAAETSGRRFAESRRDTAILRFGLFYGPGAVHSEQILRLARRHIVFEAGHPDSYMSSIHLTDAAEAVVAALTSPAAMFNIVDDDPVTKRQDTTALTKAVGVSRSLVGPGRAALLLGNRTTSMTRSVRVSDRHFRTATDWSPRYPSVREGYRAMACRSKSSL
jgi:nucleoside-diphosphate-sugar epimerase